MLSILMILRTHTQPLHNNEHFIHLFNKIPLLLPVNNMYYVGKKTFGKFLADIVKQKMTRSLPSVSLLS